MTPVRNSKASLLIIKKNLENKELAQKLGRNALKRARENFIPPPPVKEGAGFTLEKMLKGYEGLYKG